MREGVLRQQTLRLSIVALGFACRLSRRRGRARYGCA